MISLIWYMIPIALAIALSIVPIMAVIMLLLSQNPLRRSVPFAAAWTLGLFILVALFSYGSGALPQGGFGQSTPWVHTAELIIGCVLLLYGVISGIKNINKPKVTHESSLARAVHKMGPVQASLFGLALNLRPKNLILVIAASIAIGGSQLPWAQLLLTTVIFVLVSSSVVIGLVALYVLGQDRVKPILTKIRMFLERYSATLLSVLSTLVGAALVVIGALAIWG